MKTFYRRIITVVIVFLIAISASGYFIYQTYAGFNDQLVRRTALLLGGAVEEALANVTDKNLTQLTSSEKRRLRNLMKSMTSEAGSIIHILLINEQMKILLSSDQKVEGQTYRSEQELSNLQRSEPLVLYKTWDDSINVVDVILPLRRRQSEVFGYLRLVLSQSQLLDVYQDMFYVFIPIAIILAILIIFIFYFLSRAYSAPLRSIKTMASRLDEGDYSFRINYSKEDEFTDTFLSLNKTIEKVGLINASYKKTEKKINTLLQAVDDSLVLFDHDGHVTSFNKAATKLFRVPDSTSFTSYFQKIIQDNRPLQQLIRNILASAHTVSDKEMVIWLDSGHELVTRISSQVFREQDKITGLLLSFKNIQLLNELQNNLLRSMKFGVIANLASSISHEIKNPLSAMAIHTEVLNNRIKKTMLVQDNRVTKALLVLQNEVKRLNRIINQFFNLARVKKSDLTLININSIIQDVLLLVQQQAIERSITIETQLSESLDFIYGDPDQLKQVILNIILNGFQAIERHGTVLIKTRMESRRIFVEIQDSGSGMSKEVQQRIFDLYFTTKQDGGGIGLAISKNIMQAHDGRISFESLPGKGTVFRLDFPRKDKTTQVNIPTLKEF